MSIKQRLSALEQSPTGDGRYYIAHPIDYESSNGYTVLESGKPDETALTMSYDEFTQWEVTQAANVMVYRLVYPELPISKTTPHKH